MAKDLTYSNFIKSHIKSIPGDFKWQATPLQIYPLEIISNYLVLPTPLLRADFHFMVYLAKGSYQHQVGIDNYDIQSPSILYVPEREIFSFTSRSMQQDLVGFFLLMENKVVTSIMGKVELADLLSMETVITLDAGNDQWFNTVCGLLHQEVVSMQPNRKIGTGLLQALLHKLITLNSGRRALSRQHEIAGDFKQLLNKHAKDHKSVAFYAKTLGVSENYLNRCVKAHYRKSCKQIILETAVLQSQILMLETPKDISEIAFEMGFADPSYFSRVFKKVTGQTPSQFKTQIVHGLS
ncbi:helix-turn-helix domain-containing protein [Flavilitoribacter nigricans]|uniref:HTH araC/xylS-type domain-containing protein n=1 Tax=Flavilitoribacter nigricans (strain ATCC 23147 / DSM 23189 / NBRC 102662 / NCIMB 1420 / SS-2) TaxID=1122177 RepID=A0A2D0N3M8_FLAN2|nr:AraC family transcriptional regulator [Flavilitoribacter nigricans]PHN02363.1 hypothetical protein CRP01_32480 [Flavilitoribacter nigricans DSM 23189 = NBRC 102662]